MLRSRALATLTALAAGIVVMSACDRSATAPAAASPGASLPDPQLDRTLAANPLGASTLVQSAGGVVESAARPDCPVGSRLAVPAGTVAGPTYFDVLQGTDGDGFAIRVVTRPVEGGAEPASLDDGTDAPIVLGVYYAGGAGESQTVTVIFSPPDGSEAIVAKVTVQAGRTATLGFRRGRSKYSVIYF